MTCPALRLDGTAGLADALKALDCRTGEATGQAFGRLFGTNGVLLPALTILLTLFVALYAIGLLTGRARIGVASLTPRMLTLGLALTFATSWMAYQNVVWALATGAPDQIASVLAGTHGSATTAFAQSLDRMFAVIADAAQSAQNTAPTAAPGQPAPPTPAAATGFFSATSMLWLSGLMLLVGTVGVLVTSKIALAALLGVGPVFIVMALFGGTRGLFEGWLKALAMFAMIPLFVVLIGGGMLAAIAPLVRAAVIDTGETATRAVTALFLAACVYCALMVMVVKTAGTIVSGWRIPGGTARDTAEGAAIAAAGTVAAAAAAAPFAAPAAPAAAAAGDRVRAIVSALPPVANDVAGGASAGGGSRTRRIVQPATSPGTAAPSQSTGRRIDGVGSRFRARPTGIAKDRLQ